MATSTPKAGLKKPTVDDVDVWGEILNQSLDIIDNYLGELIDARGSFGTVNDRFNSIETELTNGAGVFSSIDARFDNLESALVGPFDPTETRKVPGELSRVRPNLIYEASNVWYSVAGTTFTILPDVNAYITVVDGYGRFLKFQGTSYSITVTGSGIQLIVFDSSDNVSGNRLRTVDINSSDGALGFRYLSTSLFDPRKDIALGEYDTATQTFTPYFSSTDFAGGIFRYTTTTLAITLPTGNAQYDYTVTPTGAYFGSVPSKINVMLHLQDASGNIRSFAMPFTGVEGRVAYSVDRQKLVIDIRNTNINGLQASDFQIASDFTPTTIIGYSVYLEV